MYFQTYPLSYFPYCWLEYCHYPVEVNRFANRMICDLSQEKWSHRISDRIIWRRTKLFLSMLAHNLDIFPSPQPVDTVCSLLTFNLMLSDNDIRASLGCSHYELPSSQSHQFGRNLHFIFLAIFNSDLIKNSTYKWKR